MARLPRLALVGEPHLVWLRGMTHRAIVTDDGDRRQLLAALHEASMQHGLSLHGYALKDDHVRLLASPTHARSLALTMQDFGRRYVAGFNRRHGQRGTLWDGRYRSCVVQPGAWALSALILVEAEPGLAQVDPGVGSRHAWSSAAHHRGVVRDPLVTTLLAYWQLGNTPFDREASYSTKLAEGLLLADRTRLEQGCLKGWPVGDAGFLDQLAQRVDRPVRRRLRGRPAVSKLLINSA